MPMQSLSTFRLMTTMSAHLIDVIHLTRFGMTMGVLSVMQRPQPGMLRPSSRALDVVLTAFSMCIFSTLNMAVTHKVENDSARTR